jgi:CubicO group peptidase (beta-lactamase class C family)
MNRFACLVTVGWILLQVQVGLSQRIDREKLDQYFSLLEKNNKFMGSIAIAQHDTLIYTRSTGYADVEQGIKAHQGSKYRIGSISKTFTSVMVLKALENNKIQLTQSLETYFPTIPNASAITIRHLLQHRSGIHNFTDDPDFLNWNTQPKSKQEMIAIIAKGGSDFAPGTKASYSNSNYVLLTYILERLYQKPYASLLEEQIVKPLQLRDTYLGGKIQTQKQECKSYLYQGAWKLESETDMSIPAGAGGIVSTASDLVKFSHALFNGKLLQPASLELMKTLQDNFGLGLIQIPFYERKAFGHTGGIDGFSSVFTYFSDGSISYAMVSNGVNYNTNLISIAVMSAVFNKPYQLPTFTTYVVTAEDLAQYPGSYASKQMPLKITIKQSNGALVAQASGQAPFPLEPVQRHRFRFEQAGVVIEFNPSEKSFILKQGGAQYTFTKE